MNKAEKSSREFFLCKGCHHTRTDIPWKMYKEVQKYGASSRKKIFLTGENVKISIGEGKYKSGKVKINQGRQGYQGTITTQYKAIEFITRNNVKSSREKSDIFVYFLQGLKQTTTQFAKVACYSSTVSYTHLTLPTILLV